MSLNPLQIKRKKDIVAIKFANEYIRNGENGKRAYMAIKPDAKPTTAAVEASKLLNKPNVQSEIAKLMPSDSIVSEQIVKAITQQPNDNITWSEKHSYITTALKLKGFLNKDEPSSATNIAFFIDNR